MPILLDVNSFEALFQENYKQLCASAYRIVKDKDIAEDIVQDVFLNLWNKRLSLDITVSLTAYIYKSTLNQSLNYIKKVNNINQREAFFSAEHDLDINTTEHIMSFKETNHRVEAAINALPEGCRTVFVLSRFEQMSYKEIAEQMGISVKTVENQMVKSLRFLRECILLFCAFLTFNEFF